MNDFEQRFNPRVAAALAAATKSAPYPSLVGFEVVDQTPVREGEIVAEATVLSLRKRLGTVRVDVHNVVGDARTFVATALGTVYVRDPP